MLLFSKVTLNRVVQDPDGEYLKYTIVDETTLQGIADGSRGCDIPVPVPKNPEQYNKIGSLRLQVSLRIYTSGPNLVEKVHEGIEYDAWVRVKVSHLSMPHVTSRVHRSCSTLRQSHESLGSKT
jgi:hypothetical protein